MATSKSETSPTTTSTSGPAPSSTGGSRSAPPAGSGSRPLTGQPTTDPCAVAGGDFSLLDIPAPTALISKDRVRGAGSLLLSYRYGDQLRFFDAVDRARELLDTDRLCLDGIAAQTASTSQNPDLLNRLYCWPERDFRVSAIIRRRLVAKVFGIPHPDVPENERDTAIQPMLVRLLEAINAVCDPGPANTAPTPFDRQRLEFAAFSVQARLSRSMTGLVSMQVRDLQRQLTVSTQILNDLAAFLQLPCRPGASGRDLWGSLEVLVGDRLRADGVDLFEAAELTEAWLAVFNFLTEFTGDPEITPVLCQAAAVLRPPSSSPG